MSHLVGVDLTRTVGSPLPPVLTPHPVCRDLQFWSPSRAQPRPTLGSYQPPYMFPAVPYSLGCSHQRPARPPPAVRTPATAEAPLSAPSQHSPCPSILASTTTLAVLSIPFLLPILHPSASSILPAPNSVYHMSHLVGSAPQSPQLVPALLSRASLHEPLDGPGPRQPNGRHAVRVLLVQRRTLGQ